MQRAGPGCPLCPLCALLHACPAELPAVHSNPVAAVLPLVPPLALADSFRSCAVHAAQHRGCISDLFATCLPGADLIMSESYALQVRDYKHHDGKKHELSANLPVQASHF